MKNKFEALSTFQQWPRDWQHLCAEYWAASAMREGIKPDALPTEKPESTQAIIRKRKKVFRPRFWTAIELEYLHKCHQSHTRNADAAKMFLEKYPGRIEDAIEIQIRKQVESGWKINY